jgi:hypothetical protein
MSTFQNHLNIVDSPINKLGQQDREFLDSASLLKEYRNDQQSVQSVQFLSNIAYLMSQAAKGVVSLTALLLIGGFLTALSLTPPANAQSMLKVRAMEAAQPNDNGVILAMMNKGLDDSIIVAKIKSSSWTFKLTDDDMLALRKSGVSAPVVAAMVDSSVLSTARVSIDGQSVQLDTLGQAKTAGRLLNNLTGDLTPLRENAFLEGPVAMTAASPVPDITITLPRGDTIESYILVQMNPKGDRREIEVGSGGGVTSSRTGIGSHSIRPIRVVARGESSFQLVPVKPLKPGEYMVYLIGSSDERKDIYGKGYAFSVPQ